MLAEHSTSARGGWQDGIDPGLVARLCSIAAPGVISMRAARRILGWLEHLENRRSLGSRVLRRWESVGHLEAPEHPIVHASWVTSPTPGANAAAAADPRPASPALMM